MKHNKLQRNIEIICEIHPQHMGDMNELERMIIQSKISGADFVKVQLYSSNKLFGNNDRSYLDINKDELKKIRDFCNNIGIKLSASIFDEEKLDWCEELDFEVYKIASRTVNEDTKLFEKIISKNKRTIISLGMYDYSKNSLNKNVEYLYCVSKYPAALTEIISQFR